MNGIVAKFLECCGQLCRISGPVLEQTQRYPGKPTKAPQSAYDTQEPVYSEMVSQANDYSDEKNQPQYKNH